MVQEIIEFPNVLDMMEKESYPERIEAPDGTLLLLPYATWGEQPLVINRKKWRLFANYTPYQDLGDDGAILQVNTTGRLVKVNDNDVLGMIGYVRLDKPGATVDEVISMELARTIEETGEFQNDEQMMAYAWNLYLCLAFAIQYGLLILVKD